MTYFVSIKSRLFIFECNESISPRHSGDYVSNNGYAVHFTRATEMLFKLCFEGRLAESLDDDLAPYLLYRARAI